MVVITKVNFLSTSQISCQYVVESVISEAAYNRFFLCEHMKVSFFRSWMPTKIVDLKLFFIVNHMWKNLVGLLQFRFWFVNATLYVENFICIVFEYLAIVISCIDVVLAYLMVIWLDLLYLGEACGKETHFLRIYLFFVQKVNNTY
jgi:hypothetical protein